MGIVGRPPCGHVLFFLIVLFSLLPSSCLILNFFHIITRSQITRRMLKETLCNAFRFTCILCTFQEFTTSGSSNTDTGKVNGSLETKYKWAEYGLTFTEKWNTDNTLGTEIAIEDQVIDQDNIYLLYLCAKTEFIALSYLLPSSIRLPKA